MIYKLTEKHAQKEIVLRNRVEDLHWRFLGGFSFHFLLQDGHSEYLHRSLYIFSRISI